MICKQWPRRKSSRRVNKQWVGGVNKLGTFHSMQQSALRNSSRVRELENVHWISTKIGNREKSSSKKLRKSIGEIWWEWRVKEEGIDTKNRSHTLQMRLRVLDVHCIVDNYYFTLFNVFCLLHINLMKSLCIVPVWQYSVYLHRQSHHLPICELTV